MRSWAIFASMSVVKKQPEKTKVSATSQSVVPKKKLGRPSEYRQDIADEFCAAISQDEASMGEICKRPGMPAPGTIFRWLTVNDVFRENYTRAREWQAESGSHRMRQIEEQVTTGKLDPNAARVILDSIKWRASKLAPKKYGDKLLHTGGDGESPLQIEFYMPNNDRESSK